MAIVEMKKITLAGMHSTRERCIEVLMKSGVVEQIECVETKECLSSQDSEAIIRSEKFESVLKILQKYDKRKKTLFYQMVPMEFETKHWQEKFQEVERDVESCLKISAEYQALKLDIKKSESLLQSIKPYEFFDVPLVMSSSHTKLILGHYKPNGSELKLACEKIKLCEYRENSKSPQATYCVIFYHNMCEAEILELIANHDVTIANFSSYPHDVSVGKIIEEEEKIIKSKVKICDEIEKRFETFATELELIEKGYDYIKIGIESQRAKERVYDLDYTFVLQGWIVSEHEPLVKKIAENLGVSMMCEAPPDDERPPTLLSNNRFSSNFETITKQYSLPKYKTVDPNFFLSLFFVVFFGMMIGDAGYGVIISLVAFLLLRQKGISGATEKMVRLIFFCGISTILFGALFGSWWGNLLQLATHRPEWNLALWFDPVRDPMKLLIICCMLGILHLLVGLLLKGWGYIQKGEYWSALFDVGFWILFLGGVIVLFLPTASKIGVYCVLIGGVGLVATQGRSEKNIIKRILIGLLSLYGITGYLSDVLSYSRILALGLATGIIATVINTIATLFGFSIISVILFIVVMVVGHTFNILINTLGAYIHASRLQYIEFFGKFYEGDGREFSPLREPRKYTKSV